MASDDELMAIEKEGEAKGRDPSNFAIDCPYLPGGQAAQRKAWLRGFSKHRPAATIIAKPMTRSIENTPHAG